MKLNPPQQEAVEYLGGPLFVLAGAGSGKTRVIIEKIVHMITRFGYKPYHIAAITFTNKAANEMQERIAHRLGKEQTRGLTISTFHSLGMRILREDAPAVGYKRNFSVLDGDFGQFGARAGVQGAAPDFIVEKPPANAGRCRAGCF